MMLPRGAQSILAWVVDVLIVVALLILLVQGLKIMEVTSGVKATMLEIPMSWVFAAIPVSAAIMLAYQVERTVRKIKSAKPTSLA